MTRPPAAPVLITAFRPFGAWKINSSQQMLAHLNGPPHWHRLVLPVAHAPARDQLYEALNRIKPRLCLLTGLANEPVLRLETRARLPLGWRGSYLHSGDWPWHESQYALRSAGLPVRLSTDAGRYVCEATYWALLEFKSHFHFPNSAAFLHIPPIESGFDPSHVAKAVERMLHMRERAHLQTGGPGRSGAAT